jgi:Mg2+/Co2+ transporter CorB
MYDLLTKKKEKCSGVDEYGGTSGIITIEDIVEELLAK